MKKAVTLSMIEGEAQLQALASTVRLDIVDLIQALGEASVPDLALQLGRPADALYYHLRALVKAGLVEETGVRRSGRVVEAVYSVHDQGKRLAISHRPPGRRSREAVHKIVRSMLLTAEREYREASADTDCVVKGPHRELWPSRSVCWLSRDGLARVNNLLAEVNALMSARRSNADEELYSLQFLLAPAAGRSPLAKRRRTGRANISRRSGQS